MKSAKEWFNEYADSHQNPANKMIHYICVPMIFFSIYGLLMCIPSSFLENTFELYNPLLENWAAIATIGISVFYIRIGFWYCIQMLVFSLLAIVGNYWLGNHLNLFYSSLLIFIVAWIGQFYGHHLEGKKPSFIKDIQFLLIGPLWVVKKLNSKK